MLIWLDAHPITPSCGNLFDQLGIILIQLQTPQCSAGYIAGVGSNHMGPDIQEQLCLLRTTLQAGSLQSQAHLLGKPHR